MAQHGASDRERRGKRRRLSRSAEFDRVYRQGRSHATRYLVLYAFPSTAPSGSPDDAPASPRLGVSVGRKVGGAVERNRVKRMLREAFWSIAGELPPGHDFVLLARADAGALAREQGEAGIATALRELIVVAGMAGSGEA